MRSSGSSSPMELERVMAKLAAKSQLRYFVVICESLATGPTAELRSMVSFADRLFDLRVLFLSLAARRLPPTRLRRSSSLIRSGRSSE